MCINLSLTPDNYFHMQHGKPASTFTHYFKCFKLVHIRDIIFFLPDFINTEIKALSITNSADKKQSKNSTFTKYKT